MQDNWESRRAPARRRPLIVNRDLKENLLRRGIRLEDPDCIERLYEGIFERIQRTYPLDYYWLWIPEPWCVRRNTEEELASTLADLRTAMKVAGRLDVEFQLATCGWVLGPASDRAMLDRHLPKEMPVSALNRRVGAEPVEPAFAGIAGRSKWGDPLAGGRPRFGVSAALGWPDPRGCGTRLGVRLQRTHRNSLALPGARPQCCRTR